MHCNLDKLKHPTGFIKIIEVIVGIICISLIGYGCFPSEVDGRFIFVTTAAYLIITPCILVVDVMFSDEHQKPHLAAALNSFGVILYLTTAGITLALTRGYQQQTCLRVSIALGVFAVFNTLAYAVDTVFTFLQICGHKVT